jgi:hypothetical protein
MPGALAISYQPGWVAVDRLLHPAKAAPMDMISQARSIEDFIS